MRPCGCCTQGEACPILNEARQELAKHGGIVLKNPSANNCVVLKLAEGYVLKFLKPRVNIVSVRTRAELSLHHSDMMAATLLNKRVATQRYQVGRFATDQECAEVVARAKLRGLSLTNIHSHNVIATSSGLILISFNIRRVRK